MLTAVIKKEVLHQVMSSRFLTVTLIMLVLSLLAALAGTEDYGLRSRNYRNHVEQSAQELERIHVYSFLQPVVVREPEPLSVLDRGFEARLNEEIRIEVPSVPTAANGGNPGNDFMAGTPEFDLTMIVQLVLGLLALLLTFDAVVGEKEAGTLKLVLANDVAPASIVVGKFVGACLALLIPLLAGTALTLGVLAARAGVVLDGLRWQRLGGLLAVYLLYLCLMALIGLLISLWARTTSSSLVLSLLTWLAVVFLIPQTAGALAGGIESADRARQTMREEVRRLEQDRDASLRELDALDPRAARQKYGHYAPVAFEEKGAERRRYGSAVFYDRLAAYYRESIDVSRQYAARIFQVQDRYRQQQRQDKRREQLLFWLSPAFLMERISESLAGTSDHDYDEHLTASRAYRTQLIDYLDDKGAFSSWRWFTDDPRSTIPWTSLLDPPLAPEEVDEANAPAVIAQFQSPEVQRVIKERREQYEHDPARLLVLDDLPSFEDRPLECSRASRRILPELSFLVLVNLVLALAMLGGIRRYRPSTTAKRFHGSNMRSTAGR